MKTANEPNYEPPTPTEALLMGGVLNGLNGSLIELLKTATDGQISQSDVDRLLSKANDLHETTIKPFIRRLYQASILNQPDIPAPITLEEAMLTIRLLREAGLREIGRSLNENLELTLERDRYKKERDDALNENRQLLHELKAFRY